MNVRNHEFAALQGVLPQFVFCSQDPQAAHELATGLGNTGVLVQESGESADLVARITTLSPQVVFLDFAVGGSAQKLSASVDLAQTLRRALPGLPQIAVGTMAFPGGAIAAVRAGVREFIDLSAGAVEVQAVVTRVLESVSTDVAPVPVARGKIFTIVGSRAGVGASTLAVHFAALLQAQRESASGVKPAGKEGKQDVRSRAALLDLGAPVGDGQLYLNVGADFHFAEAVRNLRRLDDTLVRTAFTHSSHHVAVLPLPRDLSEMRSVSLSDSMALMERLRLFFDAVVADVGGMSNPAFIDHLVRITDEAWLVTDQSVGSLVSLADRLRELEAGGVARDRLRLIVNRYDERYGMTAEQIAERFNVKLLATLPDRTLALMSSTNQGRLLTDVADRDPYVRGLQGLVDRMGTPASAPKQDGGWMSRLLHSNKKAHA